MPSRLFSCVALAAMAAVWTSTAAAQEAPAGTIAPAPPPASEPTLDPESPLSDLPDIGVAWPDLGKPEIATPDPAAPATAPAPVVAEGPAERRYEVKVEGYASPGPTGFDERFKALSALKAGDGKAANVAQIDRRAREDAELARELMRAEGYYDATIEPRVEPSENGERLIVTLAITPGPIYRFADVKVKGLENAGKKADELRDAFPVDVRDPVNADDVAAAEQGLKQVIGREGFPFAKVGEPEVVVDHDTRTATLELTVETGREQRMGAVIVNGDRPPFGAKHVERIARFKKGEVYSEERIEDLRRAIIATGLVSSLTIEPKPSATPGTVDLAVTMDRAPPRTIAGSVGYGTGEGFRAEASWTHRNLIRPEGAVTFRGVGGTREQSIAAVLRQSNFRERDQILNGRIGVQNIDQPAYAARTVDVGGSIERQTNLIWQKKWTWSAGFELVATDERDQRKIVGAGRQTYLIGALPATLAYDGSDDLLDPSRGFRLSARVSPEVSLRNGTVGYVRAQLDGSAYFPVGDRFVLAGRVRAGTISGAKNLTIAPSRRYYSGGGGSVRGFGYQAIGPQDAFGDPIGGRSIAEFGAEARIRFGNFGIVPFIDGGNVYASSLPKFTGFRYGAGLGGRYYSSFGPIRIDIGTPINRRAGDARVTVFVSLGQAF